MEEEKVTIQQLNPQNFEFQDYIQEDENLIATSDLDTVFNEETDYIEFYIYDENNSKIYPLSTLKLTSYKFLKGDVILNPEKDLIDLGFDDSTYNILYNFYRKRLASDISQNYYIKEISSDRTEIRLDSNTIPNLDIISSTNEFISYRNNTEHFVDFLLNFGGNKTIIANNIKLEDEDTNDPTILIKLYEPLPQEFNLKTTLWVVEEVSTPQMYKLIFPFIPLQEVNNNFIGGPNFNLNIKNESGVSGQFHNFNSLIDTDLTSSANQLQNLLDQQEITINVNYENYSDFVNFSSAKTRLENFSYKVGLIESYTNSISASLGKITGDTKNTTVYSASKASYESQINNIINNFDGYEYFLYYNSGSKYSWPKQNSTPPYTLYPTGSTEALEWLGNVDPSSIYYGGQALSASNYDQNNQDYLYWAIPEYLRDDSNNNQYLLFVDMVAQQYDNTWLYTKDLTNKFNADNRLDYGISKDLVAEAIKDFGIKLYSNNFNTNDLYTTFLGLTPSGSLFPFPEITDSFPTPSGYEYVDTRISSSNDPIALDGINKRIYKRIYHNLPYLLKTKGTTAGLRALITSYGIPDTILRVNEFGGKDRNNSQDWDLQQRVFNYAFDTEGKYIISSSFTSNDNFGGTSPETIQFRFKSNGIPTTLSQSLYYLPDNRGALVLEYTGSGLVSGSHLGSIPDPYNKYGTLKFVPDMNHANISASLYFPFFDGDWWSVQTTVNSSNTASLSAANQINKNLGFSGSSTITGFTSAYYLGAEKIAFPSLAPTDVMVAGKRYGVFSGSYQEIRYYNTEINNNVFYDYTMNPYSFEGNSINNAPDELIFRADLGTLLNTGSTTSVHPKITGSSEYITSSFSSNSEFYISSSNFVINREYIHQDQVVGGIKNRITDKITTNDLILPEGNTLSSMRSIQQTSFESSSYTPDVDYLEVAFSPQDQINDDINSQIGYFNLGEYIGDPRHISQSNRSYPDLDTLRDAYFSKYISSYNLVDFVRLMKFFDNSLFKMIKDFTPARTSLTSGVVVKQHILERNRQRPAQVSYQNLTYTGSVKPQSRNYNTGSGQVGQYEYTNGSSIYKFSGGTGGSLEKFNGLEFSPSASAYELTNKFGITQSYSEAKEGKLGREIQIIYNQDEFYNGEFSGSNITATTQSLSPDCIKYHNNPDVPLQYAPLFFSDSGFDFLYGTTTLEFWQDRRNEPQQGYAWIFTELNPSTGISSVKKIKLAARDKNGNDVRDSLIGTEFIQFLFPEGFKKYFVEGTVINTNSAVLTIEDDRGDYLFASSSNGGTENWSLRVSGDSGSFPQGTGTLPGFDPYSQGKFHGETRNQIQAFRYYNGDLGDILGFFDVGSDDFITTPLLSDETGYSYGTYTIPRTSNVPWVLSASIAYSASGGGEISVPIITQGTYHSGSAHSANSRVPQDRTVNPSLFETASIIMPGQTNAINVDPTFFNNNVNANFNGDELYPNRISYEFTTDTSFGNSNIRQVGFNNSDISLATQMFVSLYDNEGGTWIDSSDLQLYTQASNWNIYNPDNNSNKIEVTGATTLLNGTSPIHANSGNIWVVKQFTAGNAILSGSLFNNEDSINIIPNTIQDSSGHPIIEQAGTASMDFYFDQFTVGGRKPPEVIGKPSTRAVAGPEGFESSPDNNIITATLVDDRFITFPSGSEDGQISINLYKLRHYIDNNGWDSDSNPFLRVRYKARVDAGIDAPLEDRPTPVTYINIQTQYNQSAKLYRGPFLDPSSTRRFFKETEISGPSKVELGFTQLDLPALDDNSMLKDAEFNLRLAFTSFDTTLDYTFDDFYVEVAFEQATAQSYSNSFLINGDLRVSGEVDGTQTAYLPCASVSQGDLLGPNILDFPGVRSQFTVTGDVRQFLWVTGSEHHPRQLITASNELYNQILTGSSTVFFPDSPILDIERTSSYNIERFAVTESNGSSVTFQYTNPHTENLVTSTLSSYSKGIFGIREGAIQPTKTGGSGTIVSQSLGVETVYPTINTIGSMYFIEQRIESSSLPNNLFGPYPDTNHIYKIFNDQNHPKLFITNSITSGEEGYKFTGSLQIYKGNADDISTLGAPIFSRNFIVPNSESTAGTAFGSNDIQVSGSFINNFKYNDTFRLVVSANKSVSSFLDITEYTMSIFPSESKFASITEDFAYYGQVPGSASYATSSYGGEITILSPGYGKYSKPILTEAIIPSFYGSNVLPFALALDCQPLINNYNDQRSSNYLMDVDYTNALGSITPVNFQQIVDGVATKATVPDSNYYQESWTTLRYDGSKAQGSYINSWTPTDYGTYGQLPVLELRNAYFAYFSSIQDPYPLYNDSTRLNVSYLIDPQGNALPPSLQGVAKDIIDKTFPINGNTKVSLDIEATSQELQELNDENTTRVIGKYPVPIMYSQTSSRGYADQIPLSGSGRVSLYDNEGTGFSDFSFTAEGTATLSPGRNVKGIINPSSNIVRKDFGRGLIATSSYSNGLISFEEERFKPNGTSGAKNEDVLSQMQYISIQTSLPTTYIYSSDYYKKGGLFRKSKSTEYIEFTLKLGLKETRYNNSDVKISEEYIPFVAEDVRLRVWKGNQPYDAGSVIDKISFEEATPTKQQTRRGSFWRKSRYTTTYKATSGLKLDRTNRLHAKINEDAVYAILNAKGLSGKGIEEGGSIEGLEWIIIANSGETEFKKGSVLQWETDSSILPGNNNKNTILPSSFPGPKAASKITMVGSKTHLLETSNTASAPYWVYTGSINGNSTIHSQKYLVMSSSLFNEAYGNKFAQGELPYNPGPYEGFPGNQEPISTKIGKPYSTLVLEEGDEIRFGNNENYSYKIKTVFAPQDNIEGDNVGRIKIELDRPVPQTVNKDFFLIRRYLDSPNSLILSMPYPYSSTLSGSGENDITKFKPETFTSPGILFPEYPMPDIENSASILINDLISKGVIQP